MQNADKVKKTAPSSKTTAVHEPQPERHTALAFALKDAVHAMSKKKQMEMLANHIYASYAVFRQFKPLAVGIHVILEHQLPQYDVALIHRFLSNHCRKPRYLKSVALGKKRFSLEGKPVADLLEQDILAAQKNIAASETRQRLLQEAANPAPIKASSASASHETAVDE